MSGSPPDTGKVYARDRPCRARLFGLNRNGKRQRSAAEKEEEEREKVSWSELPQDILIRILAKLPVPSLLRLHAVCKEWKEAASSAFMAHERVEQWRAGVARERMLLVLGRFTPSELSRYDWRTCIYDPSYDCWYTRELKPMSKDRLRDVWPPRVPKVSAGGGMLLGSKGTLYIGNPVADSWTCLPNLPHNKLLISDVRGMLVDAEGCFKVVAVEDVLHPIRTFVFDVLHPIIRTFVFDSAVGSWSITTCTLQVPDSSPTHCVGNVRGVFVGSVLYCLTKGLGLAAYDLERASWRWLDVATPHNVNVFCCNGPMNLRGRLLCLAVGLDSGQKDKLLVRVHIWELDNSDPACMSWKVVAAMPTRMLARFWYGRKRRRSTGGIPEIRAHHNQSCADIRVVAGQDEVYLILDRTNKMVVVDF